MRLRSRINDWTYRMYDRMRHRDAWSVPVDETAGLDALRGHKYAVLVTFRRDGSPVPTPVWFGLDGSGRFYARTAARTGKVARIHHDARVQVFPSDARGEPKGMAVEGSARILPPEDAPRAEAALKASYGLGRRLYEWLLGEREAVYIEVTMPADR